MITLRTARFFSLLLMIAAGFSFSFPPDELTDLEKNGLKGKVRSVMETRWALPGGDEGSARGKILFQKFTIFDPHGYEARTVHYRDGKEYLICVYSFGNNGRQDGMREYHADGSLNSEARFTYDDKNFRIRADYLWAENRLISDTWKNTDYYFDIIQNDLFTKIIYKNEYRGYCLEEHYLKSDSSLSFRFIMKYDFQGNKTQFAYFKGNEHLSWMTKMKYDRFNNLVESNIYKSNYIAVESDYKYQFDSQGNWISRFEKRQVHFNILTAGLEKDNTITERQIEYY